MPERGYILSADAFERVSFAVRKVEGTTPAAVRTAPSRVSPAQTKIAYATTDVQPGSFSTVTCNIYASTAEGTTPTLFQDGNSSASTLAGYDLFGYGVDKRGKLLLLRPVPAKHWYAYQPPAARYGRISSFTAGSPDSVTVNPCTGLDAAGVDTDTTFTVQLPQRSGVSANVSTDDVCAYMPTLHGQYVAVSDYSAESGTVAAGSYEIDPNPGLTGASTSRMVEFSNALFSGSVDLVATGTTRLKCQANGGAKYDFSYTLSPRMHYESTNASTDKQVFTVLTQLVINSAEAPRTRRRHTFVAPTTVIGYDQYASLSCRTLLDLSSGDLIEVKIETDGNAPADSSVTIVEGEVTYLRLN